MATADIADGSEDPSLSTPAACMNTVEERSRDIDINNGNVAARGEKQEY